MGHRMSLAIVFLVLFVVLSAIHLVGEFLREELKVKVRTITKPFLLPLVVAYYLSATLTAGQDPVYLIVVGLILGFIGDVVLLKPKVEILFMIGLGSFLLGHILYIVAFLQASSWLAGVPAWVYLGILGFAAFFFFAFRYLKDSLEDMKIPVVVYMTIILVMSFAGLALMFAPTTGRVQTPWLIFFGSINFIASDFLLANQLFKKSFKYDQALIMVTYLIAQFCIAQAYLTF